MEINISKEQAFYVLAGDVRAARLALKQARAEVRKASVYEKPWWTNHRNWLKARYYELRVELETKLRLGVVVMPECFDGKL